MEDFLFLRKYRSRETARPCSGSIYANQPRDGKRMARKQNSNQIGVQHTARILSRYQCARGGHVHRQNLALIIKKTYGWLGSVVQTMDDFLFLRKYRSRETARPCSGSIYANQLRDGKRMARKQNSNQIGVQHTARILSRYQCARARWARSPAKYITYNTEDIWLTGERRSNYGRFFVPPKIPFSWDCAPVQWQHLRKPDTGW